MLFAGAGLLMLKADIIHQYIAPILDIESVQVIGEVPERILLEKCRLVAEVSMDMVRNLALGVGRCFPNCSKVIDRFHVMRLV